MNESTIVDKIRTQLHIDRLNAMQTGMMASDSRQIMLTAPTGSGKTLAFTVNMLRHLGEPDGRIRAVVIAPSRELVMQIAGVIRPIATGLKTVAFYGGHPMGEEEKSLAVTPDIVVATPGRLLDHINRGNLTVDSVKVAVLDEYDKSLELGFEKEMKRIITRLPADRRMILTSATELKDLPEYLGLNHAERITCTDNAPRRRMQTVKVESQARDKLDTLRDLLRSLPDGRAIVFLNHRESAERVYQALLRDGLPVGLYHGGLDQIDRETAIDLFNNGTTPILVSTDLGSRGLDITDVKYVIHYHLPVSAESWTHRNGRTARMDADGTVYTIVSEADNLPEYIDWDRSYSPTGHTDRPITSRTSTLYFNLGRKEKISRGDIAGFILANTGLDRNQLGAISLRDHSALAAVPRDKAKEIVATLSPLKLKNKRVKITLVNPRRL